MYDASASTNLWIWSFEYCNDDLIYAQIQWITCSRHHVVLCEGVSYLLKAHVCISHWYPAASWCKTSKTSANTYISSLSLRFEEFVHQQLKPSSEVVIHKTQRMQRLGAFWSVSDSDQWTWHFTDGSHAASQMMLPIDSQASLPLPLSLSRVYLTGCDKVIYDGIKTELAHTVSPRVNVAFNS